MKESFKFWLPPMLMVTAILCFWAFKTENVKQDKVYIFKQFSTVESVIAGGLGRSRILTTDDNGTLVEKDLLNFYSLVGINFGNIANNDRLIVEKVNEWTIQGWELYQISTGSQTNMSGGTTSTGIFITRYLFRKSQ